MTAEAGTPPAARRGPFRGIPRPVWVLCLVSFFADFSGEMVYPILPLFLTGTLGAPATAVGIVEGVAEGTANLTKLFAGSWSDRAGARKPFVVAGYALAAVGKLIVGLSFAWPFALAGRTFDRFGKGVRGAPRDALLAEFAGEHDRGRIFGLHRSMDTAGAVVGPLVGLVILHFADDRLRLAILAAVVPGVLAVLVLRALPERAPEAAAANVRARHLPRQFWLLLAVTTLFMAGNSSDAFLILRAKSLGLSATLVVLAYVVYNVVYAALSYPAGSLSDRVPRGWLLGAGYVVFAAVYAGFALAGSGAVAWPLFATYGAYIAFTDGVSKAFVGDLVPREARGTAMGIFQGVAGGAALVASVGAGVLWDTVGHAAPFAVGAVLALAAAILLAVLSAAGALRRPLPAA